MAWRNIDVFDDKKAAETHAEMLRQQGMNPIGPLERDGVTVTDYTLAPPAAVLYKSGSPFVYIVEWDA